MPSPLTSPPRNHRPSPKPDTGALGLSQAHAYQRRDFGLHDLTQGNVCRGPCAFPCIHPLTLTQCLAALDQRPSSICDPYINQPQAHSPRQDQFHMRPAQMSPRMSSEHQQGSRKPAPTLPRPEPTPPPMPANPLNLNIKHSKFNIYSHHHAMAAVFMSVSNASVQKWRGRRLGT